MSEAKQAKPFASLSSGLLARKGAAKPAMRPQGFASYGSSLEDLGWDDMGHPGPPPTEHVPSSISALTPAPGGRGHDEHLPDEQEADEYEAFEPAPEPAVVEQRRALEATFEAPSEPEPASAPVVSLPKRQAISPAPAALPARAKAAFTLRLDPDRHLKLRLACAVTRRSAQQIVTGALDEYLSSLPELDALAEHVPAEAGKRRG
jgi:hypothetical protein